MNIIIRELKANLKSFLIWAISLNVIYLVASTEYEIFAEDPSILQAMESFEFIFEVMGTSLANITTPEGYLSILSIYIFLPLSIYTALLGSGIISKEERGKTAEFMFTLPVSRTRVLTAKMIVGIIYAILINFAVVGGLAFSFGRFDGGSSFYDFLFHMSFGLIFIELLFLSIGMAMAAVLRQYKKSGTVTLAILMVTFMISMLMGMTDKIDVMKYVIPFQYFVVEDMLNGIIEYEFVFISFAIMIAGFGSMFVFFKKRDLYI